VKEILNKVVCAVMGHDWTQWAYVSSDGCAQARTCRRDGRREERIEHSFGNWSYIKDGMCNQTRSCGRCEFEEPRSEHSFKDIGPHHEVTVTLPGTDMKLTYEATMVRCQRCGAVERKLLRAA
jgi:hypothetical protein